LPGGFRYLEHGNRWHVALYLRTWAALLEQTERLNRDLPAVLACGRPELAGGSAVVDAAT